MSNMGQDEIMAFMQDAMNNGSTKKQDEFSLNDSEMDALGEIGNICMGTSATTLSSLLGKKVNITTPRVSVCRTAKEFGNYQKPFISVEVSYTEGVDGYNILLMKQDDVKIITDLLMGGEGQCNPDEQIDELHFSAISEVMNQMVGSASTSLSNIIHAPVNISPPKVRQITLEEEDIGQLACRNDVIIKISFTMEIEGILLSELMQIIPFQFGKKLANGLLNDIMSPAPSAPPPAPKPAPKPAPHASSNGNGHAASNGNASVQTNGSDKNRVGVKTVQYQSFDSPGTSAFMQDEFKENIGLIMDVPLQVTVELGKCRKSIKEILSFNMGSVIVLDRLAGEMVDILVNGKLFARGEVVVIDDSYGVRVTDIITPQGQ